MSDKIEKGIVSAYLFRKTGGNEYRKSHSGFYLVFEPKDVDIRVSYGENEEFYKWMYQCANDWKNGVRSLDKVKNLDWKDVYEFSFGEDFISFRTANLFSIRGKTINDLLFVLEKSFDYLSSIEPSDF